MQGLPCWMVPRSGGQTILSPMHSGEWIFFCWIFFWEQSHKVEIIFMIFLWYFFNIFFYSPLLSSFLCSNLSTGQTWSVEQHQARRLRRLCDWDSVKGSQSDHSVPNVCNREKTRRKRKYGLQQLSCWKIWREEFRRWRYLHGMWSWTVHQQLQRAKMQSLWSRRVPKRRRKNSLSSMRSRERFFFLIFLLFFLEQFTLEAWRSFTLNFFIISPAFLFFF